MRCLVISYFRAAELARRVHKAGCPRKFFHPYGWGQRKPLTTDKDKADENRRVDISFWDEHAIRRAAHEAEKMWQEIKPTSEFVDFVKDRTNFDHEYQESIY